MYIAIMRLVHGNIEINADRMMAVAAGGIVINLMLVDFSKFCDYVRHFL